jgi:hypothetical protein
MDMEQFDSLTRRLGAAGSSRRLALRSLGGVLLGGAFGSVSARLGLAEVAAARPKQNKAKPKRQRAARAAEARHGKLQAEGKRKKKRDKKRDKKPKPDEPCSLDKFRCPDGTCVPWGTCCEGERRCNNSSPPCIPSQTCCPGERDCEGDGSVCAKPGECCPAEQKCGNECYPKDECCPPLKPCDGGTCIPQHECCPGTKRCGNECIPTDECCELSAPLTCNHPCEEPVCDNGTWRCQRDLSLCPDCPAGTVACPGRWSCDQGWCCPSDRYSTNWPTPGRPFCSVYVGCGGGVYCD